MTQKFKSVWDAVEDTPQEAQNMRVRSALMMAIEDYINRHELTQAEAAKLFGVSQPRISELMCGKINLFAIDKLINMAAYAGLKVEVRLAQAA